MTRGCRRTRRARVGRRRRPRHGQPWPPGHGGIEASGRWSRGAGCQASAPSPAWAASHNSPLFGCLSPASCTSALAHVHCSQPPLLCCRTPPPAAIHPGGAGSGHPAPGTAIRPANRVVDFAAVAGARRGRAVRAPTRFRAPHLARFVPAGSARPARVRFGRVRSARVRARCADAATVLTFSITFLITSFAIGRTSTAPACFALARCGRGCGSQAPTIQTQPDRPRGDPCGHPPRHAAHERGREVELWPVLCLGASTRGSPRPPGLG